jgi:hypothetical protein
MSLSSFYIFIQNPDKIYWAWFSRNPNQTAVDFLIKTHPNKINWEWFSLNPNQTAVDFLIKTHPNKINWEWFSVNPNQTAVDFLIKTHPNKINWEWFSRNPILFDLDYQAMSLARLLVYELELCHKAVLDPRRVKVWLDDFLEHGGELYDFKYEPYSVSNF